MKAGRLILLGALVTLLLVDSDSWDVFRKAFDSVKSAGQKAFEGAKDVGKKAGERLAVVGNQVAVAGKTALEQAKSIGETLDKTKDIGKSTLSGVKKDGSKTTAVPKDAGYTIKGFLSK